MRDDNSDADEAPLLSTSFLWKVVGALAALSVASLVLSYGAARYGAWLAQDGRTDSEERLAVTIGQDTLALPANMFRFPEQRKSGDADQVDIVVAWPEMAGYSAAIADRFNQADDGGNLLFLQYSQSVMSRDMSGRLEPIYRRLFSGEPQPGPGGLSLHRLDPNAGYGAEVILTGDETSPMPFVTRCILPQNAGDATSSDCQRDIHVGRDLTLLYRFSSRLLPEWRNLDRAVRDFSDRRLDPSP
ncbi:hypothetical protein [Rhizobium sp. G21]|uniref:hypothetical protein n=1 Tax=Rhizobium sp. G21 TaxID=2758439 RepID=UPI00160303EB|nr:hypothetical protein [Rhizobium sp. G21]MBB1247838.1 hypothetical protein [Rhizobium sp. G21]